MKVIKALAYIFTLTGMVGFSIVVSKTDISTFFKVLFIIVSVFTFLVAYVHLSTNKKHVACGVFLILFCFVYAGIFYLVWDPEMTKSYSGSSSSYSSNKATNRFVSSVMPSKSDIKIPFKKGYQEEIFLSTNNVSCTGIYDGYKKLYLTSKRIVLVDSDGNIVFLKDKGKLFDFSLSVIKSFTINSSANKITITTYTLQVTCRVSNNPKFIPAQWLFCFNDRKTGAFKSNHHADYYNSSRWYIETESFSTDESLDKTEVGNGKLAKPEIAQVKKHKPNKPVAKTADVKPVEPEKTPEQLEQEAKEKAKREKRIKYTKLIEKHEGYKNKGLLTEEEFDKYKQKYTGYMENED